MTIPDLISAWHEGDTERGKLAPALENVVHLWYAHGAQLPKPDSLARRSPLVGPTVETQAWEWVRIRLSERLLRTLSGVIQSADPHPVGLGIAFMALDILAEEIGEGRGFIPGQPVRVAENVDADGNPNSNDEPVTLYEQLVETGNVEPTFRDQLAKRIRQELGLKPKGGKA